MDRDELVSMFDLTDRVAIVTGGTRGIGFAIAEGLVAAGAKVVVASRKPDACDNAARALSAAGGEAIGVPTHVGDLDSIRALVDATVRRFGAIDLLVNNAATAIAAPIGQLTPAAWAKSLDVNVRGPVFLVQAALAQLKASKRASVLNLLSGGAFTHAGGHALYAAGKAALLSFTRSMAAELAPDGIRVNALSPGTTDTDMIRNLAAAQIQDMVATQLLARLAKPAELVGPALLLLSDAGGFITGQVIFADGGMVAAR
jgi:NAD(P)-dependent dehydrogenase (short-subunit alcohol dehydrogenase family)